MNASSLPFPDDPAAQSKTSRNLSPLDFAASAIQGGSDLGQSLIEWGASLPLRTFNFAREGIGTIQDGADALCGISESVSKGATDLVGACFEKILLGLTTISRESGNLAEDGMAMLAGDPTKDQGVTARGIRLGVGLLPIVGNLQGVAQARNKYRVGSSLPLGTEKDERMHSARRDCLIACTAFALEIATLGVSGKIGTGLKAGGITLSALNAGKVTKEETKKVSWIPTINLDFLSSHADRALEFSPIRDAMDIILRTDLRSTSQSNA